jgi:hypothetical protein
LNQSVDIRWILALGQMLSLRSIYRAWYYFRLGYSTYLTFLLGYATTLVTVYYLAIKNIPSLLDIFPKFVPFAALATVIGVPLSVGIGWIHLKRSGLFSTEQDLSMEANPYLYKLQPGYAKEVTFPAAFLQLTIIRRLADNTGLLTEAEKAQLNELESKFSTLLSGGYVGEPRRKLNF